MDIPELLDESLQVVETGTLKNSVKWNRAQFRFNMNKLIQFLRSPDNRLPEFLIFSAIGLPVLLIFIGQFLLKGSEPVFTIIIQFSMILMFFLIGFYGFVTMIRKEFRQVITFHGKKAQRIGLFICLSAWGLLVYILYWIFLISQY